MKNADNSAKKEITYQKLFWLFLVGNVLGVILEGLWCTITNGKWETHVTFLWGAFNIVYGIGAVAIYSASVYLKNKKILIKFMSFALIGALIEYVIGVFQEVVLKSTSWDYSNQKLNIGGKVSLLFTIFWGILGVLFTYYALPFLNKILNKMKSKPWNVTCVALSIFMLINFVFSMVVLIRWGNRLEAPAASNSFMDFIDKMYPNDYLQERFCEWVHIQS